jgi:hypothetical protein
MGLGKAASSRSKIVTVLYETPIPTHRVKEAQARIARFAKRAQAKGLPVPTLTLGEPTKMLIGQMPTPYGPKPIYGEAVKATLSASGPLALGNWRLLAAVDQVPMPDGTTAPVRRKVMDHGPLPDDILLLQPTMCQQCGKNRRRTMTLVVSDGTEYRQVGRNCVKDLTGHNPADLLDLWGRLREWMDEDWDSEGSWQTAQWFDPRDVVSLAVDCAVRYGYTSRKMAEEKGLDRDQTTRGDVEALLYRDIAAISRYNERSHDPVVTTQVDHLYAATVAALDELLTRTNEGNEYEDTLRTLWRSKAVQQKHVGYLVGAVSLGFRRLEREGRLAAKPVTPSTYLAPVGTRVRGLTAKVTFIRAFAAEWPQTERFLIKMRAGESDLIWWTGKIAHHLTTAPETAEYKTIEVGGDVLLDATVKAHDVDKFTEQPVTILTRGTVKGIAEPAHA